MLSNSIDKIYLINQNTQPDNYDFFLLFAESPKPVVKQDFFYKDFIHGTTIAGSWIDQVGAFDKTGAWTLICLCISLFAWLVGLFLARPVQLR